MRTTLPTFLAAFVAAVLATASAQAQNERSFVASSAGASDGNTCSTETSPCRTMSGALGKTVAGGAIYCLDNGDFGGDATTVITKSITIDCAGTGASLVNDLNTIGVSATATDVIHIRGLKVFSSGGRPLSLLSTGVAASVRVEGCDLVGNASDVVFVGSSASTNVLELFFVNTTISNGGIGINLAPSGPLKLTLDNVRIFNNAGSGMQLIGSNATTAPGLRVMVKNSTITGNGIQGIRAQSTNGTTRVFAKDSVIAQNDVGLQADGAGAVIFASGTAITQNNHGLSAINGGRLFTYGNNETQGNVQTNGVFSSAVALQ